MDNPENKALLSKKNVSITPHMAWYSEESQKELRRKAAMEIARVLKGEKPLHIVH
jgi:D-3-phosphoglycerate dehydrogenase